MGMKEMMTKPTKPMAHYMCRSWHPLNIVPSLIFYQRNKTYAFTFPTSHLLPSRLESYGMTLGPGKLRTLDLSW